jgi:hypothetical protein
MAELTEPFDPGPLGHWMEDALARKILARDRAELLNARDLLWNNPVADAMLVFVDHGEAHQQRVSQLLDELLGTLKASGLPDPQANDLEVYMLAIAAVLHDVGIYWGGVWRDPSAGKDAKKWHAEWSAQRIRDENLSGIVDPTLAEQIASIVAAHSGEDWRMSLLASDWCSWMAMGGTRYQIRPQFLAALLRLADAMDIGCHRLLLPGGEEAELKSRLANVEREIRALEESKTPDETVLRSKQEYKDILTDNLKHHHPRHAAVRRVELREDAFYVVPLCPADLDDPDRRGSLEEAAQDLRREVEDPPGAVLVINEITNPIALPNKVIVSEPPYQPQRWEMVPPSRDSATTAEETVAGMEELVSPERGEEHPSDIAPEVTRWLAEELETGTSRIVLHGPGGVGKSRIVAGLFGMSDAKLPRMLRFRGGAVDVGKLIGAAGQLGRPCIVFDENHQDTGHRNKRDREFFRGLLEPNQLAALCEKAQILLSVRTSTFEELKGRFGGFVVHQHAGVPPGKLDDYQAWHLEKELTAEQKEQIAAIAGARYGGGSAGPQRFRNDDEVDERLLLPILVDVCMKALRAGRRLSEATFRSSDVREQIWNLVTASSGCDIDDKRVLGALALVIAHGSMAPSYLIGAILRSCGIAIAPEDVAARLQVLCADEIVRTTQLPPFQECVGWEFAHDLYYESALSHAKEQVGTSAIHHLKMAEAAVELAGAAKPDIPEVLDELGKLYAAAVQISRAGQPTLAQAIVDACEVQVADGSLQGSEYASSLARIVLWTERLTDFDVDLKFLKSLYEASCLLADAISRHTTAREVLGMGAGRYEGRTPILSMGYALARLAFAAGIQEEAAFIELSEAKIEPLRAIGRNCHSEAVKLQAAPGDEVNQGRLAILMMWAGDFRRAADLFQQVHTLPVMEKAAGITLESGDPPAAARLYRQAADWAANQDGMDAARKIYLGHARILEGAAAKGESADWLFLMRCHEQAVKRWGRSAASGKPRAAIICNYPEIPVASQLAEAFARHRLDAKIAYVEVVAKSSSGLGLLTKDIPVVILGSHKAGFVGSLIRAIASKEDINQMVWTCGDAPRYGRVRFSADGRPVLWVAGWYDSTTAQAVRALIEDEGYMKILR